MSHNIYLSTKLWNKPTLIFLQINKLNLKTGYKILSS